MKHKPETKSQKIIRRITNKDYLKSLYHQLVAEDRRYHLKNLAKIKSGQRRSESKILNFYSGTHNIGDIIPVLGIRRMLNETPDVWSMLDRNIDFDFINRNYSRVIIGGAGLLDFVFERFWNRLLHECKLPITIWGVGITSGKTSPDYLKTINSIGKRCDLINVRDNLTAEIFGFDDPSITVCPCTVYLQDYKDRVDRTSNSLLYSSHERSISVEEKKKIKAVLAKSAPNYRFSDHVQYSHLGLEEIIEEYYCNSGFVLTSRLHGAIIAYGLGIPYLAIDRAPKTNSFVREYGNGLMTDNLDEIGEIVRNRKEIVADLDLQPIAIQPVIDFGNRVKDWSNLETSCPV